MSEERGSGKNLTDGTDIGGESGVTLFNCSCHSFDQVEKALIVAIKCGIGKARSLATTIHNKGSVLVYEGPSVECENVAMILEAAGLKVKIQK